MQSYPPSPALAFCQNRFEVAVEVDPVVTTRAQLALLRSFGFNRISLGVQDLDPKVQKAIDRIQTEEETRSVVEYARSLGERTAVDVA